MLNIDLHVHTNFSDGLHSPEEVLRDAKKAGIKVIALSDHNWPQTMKQKVALAKKLGMESIEALEISTQLDSEVIHILGYSKNFNDEILKNKLAGVLEGYRKRTEKYIHKINSSGIVSLNMAEVDEVFKGFKHDFQAVIVAAKKLGKPIKETKKILSDGYEAGHGQWMLTPKQAIDIIHEAGGISIWAHPMHTMRKTSYRLGEFDEVLDQLINEGLDGIEVNHPEHTDEMQIQLIKKATEKGLIVTGGSDFHGMAVHTHRSLGKNGPSEKEFAAMLEKLDQI